MLKPQSLYDLSNYNFFFMPDGWMSIRLFLFLFQRKKKILNASSKKLIAEGRNRDLLIFNTAFVVFLEIVSADTDLKKKIKMVLILHRKVFFLIGLQAVWSSELHASY